MGIKYKTMDILYIVFKLAWNLLCISERQHLSPGTTHISHSTAVMTCATTLDRAGERHGVLG